MPYHRGTRLKLSKVITKLSQHCSICKHLQDLQDLQDLQHQRMPAEISAPMPSSLPNEHAMASTSSTANYHRSQPIPPTNVRVLQDLQN